MNLRERMIPAVKLLKILKNGVQINLLPGYDVEDGTMVVDGVARNPGIKKARRYKRLADKLKLEPMIGIEPMTYSLRVNCSTD